MRYLPIAVKLRDRCVVIVGAGKVAERKISNCLDAGAKVYIVSPKATPNIRRLAKNKDVEWVKRRVTRSDVRGARLIISATDNKAMNNYVRQWGKEFEIPVNVVDNSKISDFISPALLRFKKALIAVYTDGKDPVLSRDLKNYIRGNWDDFVSYRNRS
ncbi:MAG: bifunctional precorrin-2 dehydrogenase/sirohydrochlorin ferrochelatase [Candidatus Omnitrophica bacterium]|nr:bifunctional precorrin-2 dehydrogenase/sirohydrochlorin ferrochelatase [Candidatus Omnitrophota bacterium]MBU4589434.1 bifunctional precorrin-2 dehydrogenase/sirohydrochlorin ferrochelatase [Candidatus Omnitrophota bacterium]